MCLARRYKSITCRHQWLRISRPCGRDADGNRLGFTTCSRWREGHAAVGMRYSFATRVRNSCPICDLNGDYDPARTVMIHRIQRGIVRRANLSVVRDNSSAHDTGQSQTRETSSSDSSTPVQMPLYAVPPHMFELPLRPRVPQVSPPQTNQTNHPTQSTQFTQPTASTPVLNGVGPAGSPAVVPVSQSASSTPPLGPVPFAESATPAYGLDRDYALASSYELADALVQDLRNVLQDIFANALLSQSAGAHTTEAINRDSESSSGSEAE